MKASDWKGRPMLDLPSGSFTVIVADPPWLYKKNPRSKGGGSGRRLGYAEHVYQTMTNEDIAAMPVSTIAAPVAHLFMWVTNPGLYGGRFSTVTPKDIADAWGFEYKTMLTWVKTRVDGGVSRGGMGWYFRGATEHILYAVRGGAGIPSELREPNVIEAPCAGHSRKPDELQNMIDRAIPDGARIELFARRARPGWVAYGLEVAANAD